MTISQTKPTLPIPPGTLGLPLIGETLSFLRDADFVKKRQEKYGSVFKTNILGSPHNNDDWKRGEPFYLD